MKRWRSDTWNTQWLVLTMIGAALILLGVVLDGPGTSHNPTPTPTWSPGSTPYFCTAYIDGNEVTCVIVTHTPSPRADRSRPTTTPSRRAVSRRTALPVRTGSGLNWAALRRCESNGSGGYRANTGNGYYGAYQANLSTWNGVMRRHAPEWVGVRPDQAPPSVQDSFARWLYTERGRQPWPTCGRLL